MLEDVELVESLEETKRTAVSVTEQVKAAKESEVGLLSSSLFTVHISLTFSAAPLHIPRCILSLHETSGIRHQCPRRVLTGA